MKAHQRRNEILSLLGNASLPIPAGILSEKFAVSRQVIVQDIAVLRAEGYDVISTNRGYLLGGAARARRVFKCRHALDELVEEAALMIDLGGRVVRRIDCPGHTEGSVIFADEKEKLLFTGDAIGRAQWLFTDAASTTTGYAERWERLSPSLISYREMWISHSRKPLEIGFIEGFVAALRDVNPENCKKIKLKGAEEPILVHVGKYGGAGKITVWAFPGQVR